ncbi:Ribonuclease 3-like protein 2, partial [Mucuna pruriens]
MEARQRSSESAEMEASVLAKLLEEALTHSSFTEAVSYERLEFISDPFLSLTISNHLFLAYPALDPGHLSLLRVANASTEKLARVAICHQYYPPLVCAYVLWTKLEGLCTGRQPARSASRNQHGRPVGTCTVGRLEPARSAGRNQHGRPVGNQHGRPVRTNTVGRLEPARSTGWNLHGRPVGTSTVAQSEPARSAGPPYHGQDTVPVGHSRSRFIKANFLIQQGPIRKGEVQRKLIIPEGPPHEGDIPKNRYQLIAK